jgi:hypothetical protein
MLPPAGGGRAGGVVLPVGRAGAAVGHDPEDLDER